MNIVFYVLILVAMGVVYFYMSFLFKWIGKIAVELAKTFKNNITDEREEGEDKHE